MSDEERDNDIESDVCYVNIYILLVHGFVYILFFNICLYRFDVLVLLLIYLEVQKTYT